ncbi:MAG: efflux RND transporter permease subunit [Marinilabiliales bacterium]|nr:MAG: efflux RND transporter permease subunit [Marinilabiliales bacterium]
MSIYKSAVNKPITTFMIFTAVIVMGIYSLIYIPVDLYPEMEPPFISVITSYPGANASDIETNVTRPLEDAFNRVDKLKEITSVSSDNLSVIFLEFEWESDMNEASNDIRDAIDLLYDYLPDEVSRPTIFKFDISMVPIVFYAFTADESYPGLAKILDERIINPLNRIDGIGSVMVIGSPQRRIYVEADPVRLDAYNLTIEQIGNAIRAENLNMPSGNIRMGMMDYQLRVEGEISESYELEDLVVGHFMGNSIYLRDVAQVRDTLRDVSIDSRITGRQGVRMMVMKQSGANTVRVARDVKSAIEELQRDLPPDIEVQEIIDTSVFISNSVSNLSRTMLWALFFVVLVVLFFLGKWRATFIVVLTIPISLIVSFIYLYVTGGSLNVISLASLSIALGMVVDDAIVVLENISRHVERGTSPREAAIYATNEVWLSVIITTLVIVAVFFPLTLVGGMTGVLFRQLGWIVTITVVTSTLAAITLTPMMASQLLELRKKGLAPGLISHARIVNPIIGAIEGFYEKSLRVALRNKRKVLALAVIVFAGSLFLLNFISTEFMPETDESRINAEAELTTGLRVEETIKVARELERIIEERYPEVRLYAVSAGSDDEGGMAGLFGQSGSNMIDLVMRLSPVDQRDRSVWEIADDLRRQMEQIPEIVEYSVTAGGGGMGSTTVDVEIFGYDFEVTTRLANEIHSKIEAIPGAEDVQISRKDERPELQVVLDRNKLAENGLNTAMVSSAIRNRVAGMTASIFREEGEEYDIIVRYGEEFRSSVSDLEAITITNPMGNKIRLAEVGEVREYWNPPNIERKRRDRVVTVSAVPSGIALGDLASEINSIVSSTEIPPGVLVNVGGAYEDMMDSFMDLGLLLLISLILVFLVMASQFESFVMPFVIMFSIPFSFTGVLLALFLTNTTLSVIAGLGAVLLIGIVVKNGIVLIDYINLMRDRGHALNEAIAMSGRLRLRPVLMTAMTTMMAMLPLALSRGEGSEIWSPMGITLIGGLLFSTAVTLILVPVVYGIFSRRGERDKLQKIRNKFTFLNCEDK